MGGGTGRDGPRVWGHCLPDRGAVLRFRTPLPSGFRRGFGAGRWFQLWLPAQQASSLASARARGPALGLVRGPGNSRLPAVRSREQSRRGFPCSVHAGVRALLPAPVGLTFRCVPSWALCPRAISVWVGLEMGRTSGRFGGQVLNTTLFARIEAAASSGRRCSARE